jgi:hypothetical protein
VRKVSDLVAINNVTVDLVNLTTAQSLLPPQKLKGSFTRDSTAGSVVQYLNLSGSTMVSLNANDIIELELSSVDEVPIFIRAAVMSMKQIA